MALRGACLFARLDSGKQVRHANEEKMFSGSPLPFPWLTFEPFSLQMDVSKEGTSRPRIKNEYPRPHRLQAPEDHPRARLTHQLPARHTPLWPGRPQFRHLTFLTRP